ncbi:hypothetical protein ACOQFV_24665 [Nocardiopsis changdeensis]|uniref:Uncharacterized protein n=1 Tax=Nocardiopsis changdeensis TaxID=2831969 RepID=A0A975KSQ6_9ACTN|nr:MULTISPECIES: hypothetical protein [Nocardiopsis]QUX26416.1 hypothetical protein KGD84_32475 [Nocardiopsis changdeensis]QYX40688.1 hypothetical protein K1J57_32325 [Nocardiopsis sp. MT53]
MEPALNTPPVPRRIPTTVEDQQDVITIAEMADGACTVVKNSLLVPTGVLLTLYNEYDQSRVITLLQASGYTVTVATARVLVVTGAIGRLEMLRAERDRLTAEIAHEEQRLRSQTAAR